MDKEILQKENPVLRETAKEVPQEKIASEKIQKVIKEMTEALEKEKDGVAIAAPQIGYSLRIFVVSKKVFEEKEKPGRLVFINPEIINQSKESKILEEGCLSCRRLYGKVSRREKTKVRAYDENGKLFEYGGSGLLSQIFQHEIDHLNGILFLDKAEDVVEVKSSSEEKNTSE